MGDASTISFSAPEPDIGLLTLDAPNKSANILSLSVLDELSEQLDAVDQRTDLAGLIIISGKPSAFIHGADISEFLASLDMPKDRSVEICRKGQNLFGRLSKCPFVTVAAIDGVCLGGGAELASWCDRRVFSDNPKTQFGFPEVKLGLYPGWGGTARAPRMVGLGNAVELVTGGESIDADTARRMGWADDVVPAERLLDAAIRMVREETKTQAYWKDRARWSQPIEISETELGFLGVTASAYIQQQTKGHYPAPMAALETMLGAAGVDSEQALRMEAEGMSQLFGSPVNASLINVFFLVDRNKKDRGISDENITPAKVESVGVLGAGIMGAGIAAANVKRKIPTVVGDASHEALGKGLQGVMEEVSYNRATKAADVKRAIEFSAYLNGAMSDVELARADVVIEAVIENADVKKQVFGRLEPQLQDHAILASNTSTIPITQLATSLKRPDRFCGIHFFNPVRRMKLVEVIRGEETSDQTVATAVAYAKSIGKSPIVVNDGPGFLVNRLLLPYMNEALELISEGVEIKAIERAATKFGMPMGPITLYDVVGLDTAMYAGRVMLEAFPSRIGASPILPSLVKAGRLGQKSGAGFFSYQNKKKKARPDPALAEFINDYIRKSDREYTHDEITARLFLPMLLEATRVLEDNIVRDPRDVDLGLIFGIGFPPFKGGLLFWADSLGAESILEMLKPLESLGKRAQPTEMLREMAKDGRKFYA